MDQPLAVRGGGGDIPAGTVRSAYPECSWPPSADQMAVLARCAGWSEPVRSPDTPRASSRQVLGEVLGHLEHGRPVPAEHLAERVVGQDFAAVRRVLQIVRLDVIP